jgi:hypothetical protein
MLATRPAALRCGGESGFSACARPGWAGRGKGLGTQAGTPRLSLSARRAARNIRAVSLLLSGCARARARCARCGSRGFWGLGLGGPSTHRGAHPSRCGARPQKHCRHQGRDAPCRTTVVRRGPIRRRRGAGGIGRAGGGCVGRWRRPARWPRTTPRRWITVAWRDAAAAVAAVRGELARFDLNRRGKSTGTGGGGWGYTLTFRSSS